MALFRRAFIIVFIGLAASFALAPLPAHAQATKAETIAVMEARIAQIQQEVDTSSDPVVMAQGEQRIADIEGQILQVDTWPQIVLQSQFDYYSAFVSPS